MTSRTDLDVRLSWIVVSHQSGPDLAQLLPSLTPVLQRWRMAGVSCELIIIDNASTDDSVAVAQGLAPDALLIESARNVGYGPAINTAARRARGEWLVIGNADLVIPPGDMDALPGVLAALPADVALAGPAMLDREGEATLSAGFFPTLTTLVTGLARRCQDRKYLSRRRHVAGEVDWVTGACLFARREQLQQAGGFDQEFFLYYEDVDLAQRLARAGKRCMYVPAVRVVHLSPHHVRPPQARIETIVRASRRAYFAKHRPAWERLCLALMGKLEPIIRRPNEVDAEQASPVEPLARSSQADVPAAARPLPSSPATERVNGHGGRWVRSRTLASERDLALAEALSVADGSDDGER